MNLGTVARVDLRSATVLAPDGREIPCRVRAAGIMDRKKRLRGGVVVGDAVEWEGEGERTGIVEGVLPRRNAFCRRATGREAYEQVVAANLDEVFAVASLAEPPLHAAVLDRMCVAAHQGSLPLTVVLNKTDLVPAAAADAPARLYRSLGYRVLLLSATRGDGVDTLADAIGGRRALFVGHSGVGKSTLLERLVPGLAVRIGEISAATGRGRHTTTAAVLVRLPSGTEIVDTPGFRSFAPWAAGPEDVAAAFPEIRGLAGGCRFRDCRHATEPDCAVRAATERGEIAAARYQSYRKLVEEAQAEEERA